MKIRYLPDILRGMTYYQYRDESKREVYRLQLIDEYRLIFSEEALTDKALLEGAKAVGVPIRGKHWADYMTPENALEKRMMDDVKLLSSIVARGMTIEDLEALGYSKTEAKKILKDAAYMVADG